MATWIWGFSAGFFLGCSLCSGGYAWAVSYACVGPRLGDSQMSLKRLLEPRFFLQPVLWFFCPLGVGGRHSACSRSHLWLLPNGRGPSKKKKKKIFMYMKLMNGIVHIIQFWPSESNQANIAPDLSRLENPKLAKHYDICKI